MKKKILFILTVLATPLFIFGTDSRLVHAADCQSLLANNRYRCQVKSELGFQGELCFQSVSPGSVSSKFDLQPTAFFATTLGCMCTATKTFNAPGFNSSKGFLCGNPEFGDAATGTVTGNGQKILKGQYFFSGSPNAHVFQCTLDPSCS